MGTSQKLSAGELAMHIAKGETSSEDVCATLSTTIEANAELNAYSVFDRSVLLEQAKEADVARNLDHPRGPLHGVPLILKDNINTTALPTSGGTPALKDNTPGANAPIAARLFQAGALLAGKANLHELSFGGTSANHTFGRVRNPYDHSRVPGGSSGGTAAAIAAGLAPAGLGTDTAGSVRVPAALCGIYGFRPSTGRYSADGIVPLSKTQDTAGPLATTIDDIILLDGLLAGAPTAVKPKPTTTVRLGVAEHLIESSTSAVSDVICEALARLSRSDVTLIPVDLAPVRELQRAAADGVIGLEFPSVMSAYLEQHAPGVSLSALVDAIASPMAKSVTQERLDTAYDMEAYAYALGDGLRALQAKWQALFDDHTLDAIAFPTTLDVALPWTEDDSVLKDGESVSSWFYFRHTAMGSVGRRPGLSIPAGLSRDGLPVGLEIDGVPGKDEALLAVAKAIAPLVDV